VPGAGEPAYGAAPNSIAIDAKNGIAYVALYNANAIGVVDITKGGPNPVLGMIPVGYAPSSVVLDHLENKLIVANDKGVGTRYSFETDYGVTAYNTPQDNGTVSIIPLPDSGTLEAMTKQVWEENNHWDLAQNITAASGGNSHTKPVAIPHKIGDPSLIKHVFLIIRENRTYDQVLGDVSAGNGDPFLAVFGGKDTPNAHKLINGSLCSTTSTTRAGSRLTVINGSLRAWHPTPTTSNRRTGSAAIRAGMPEMHSRIRRRASSSRKRRPPVCQ